MIFSISKKYRDHFKMNFTIDVVILCLISINHINGLADLTKCERDNGNCENFSFRRIQNNVSNVNNLSEQKSLKTELLNDFGIVENQIVLEKSRTQENVFLENIASKLSRLTPAFNPSRSKNTSAACKIHTGQFLDALSRLELWAFQMHDASAKIPSGILSGNINQLGDFDECLNVQSPNNEFTGKYCLAYVQMTVPDYLPNLVKIRKLVHAHDAFVNDFDDPGHRVPRFSIINYALCVPSTCTNLDVESSVNEYLKEFVSGTAIQYQLRVENRMCQVKKERVWSQNTKIAIIFFASMVLIAMVSTIIEFYSSNPNELLVSFSLLKNSKALFSLDRNPSDVSTIHGIRFIVATLLLLSHKSMALFYNSYTNRTQMIENIGENLSIIARTASIYTDAFIMLSGLLTSYAIVGRLKNNQSPRILQEYFSRFLRIVPTLGALIIFCTFILPELGAGPQWNLVVNQHADICKQNWWRNFLFIHNYYGFEEMCLTHTHHLGIDTQLFLLSPILIMILWKWPKMGSIGLFSIAILSTGARFYVTIAHQLSNYVYFGASIKQLFRTADMMYSIPIHRATIYIFGIFTGYAMRMYKNVKLTKSQLIYGWSISFLILTIALFGPAKMGNINYKYNVYDAAFYAAFSPMACTIFAWIIYTTHIGYPTVISDILSCRLFLITTRLAYAVYLTQFPIFFYNVGTIKHSGFYNFITSNGNLYEIFSILAISAVLTLLFDTPFQNIKKYMLRNKIPKLTTNKNEPSPNSHKHD